jgi:hypothetical protein
MKTLAIQDVTGTIVPVTSLWRGVEIPETFLDERGALKKGFRTEVSGNRVDVVTYSRIFRIRKIWATLEIGQPVRFVEESNKWSDLPDPVWLAHSYYFGIDVMEILNKEYPKWYWGTDPEGYDGYNRLSADGTKVFFPVVNRATGSCFVVGTRKPDNR